MVKYRNRNFKSFFFLNYQSKLVSAQLCLPWTKKKWSDRVLSCPLPSFPTATSSSPPPRAPSLPASVCLAGSYGESRVVPFRLRSARRNHTFRTMAATDVDVFSVSKTGTASSLLVPNRKEINQNKNKKTPATARLWDVLKHGFACFSCRVS